MVSPYQPAPPEPKFQGDPKPVKIPTGIWSKMMYDAISRAEIMMLQTTQDVKQAWSVKSEELTLEHLQYERFLDMLTRADQDEEASATLNETLSRLLIPIIQQAMMQLAQPPGGQK